MRRIAIYPDFFMMEWTKYPGFGLGVKGKEALARPIEIE